MGKVEKNFLWLSAANIVGSFFTVALFIYLARTLEAGSFGYLSYATTLAFYFMSLVDLGLSTYGIREVAKDRSAAQEYVSNIVSFKIIIAGLLFLVFGLVTFILPCSVLLKVLMAEAALMFFIAALATEWAFQGLEKMYMVFASLATTGFLQLLLSVIFVRKPDDAWKAPIITFVASLPIAVIFLRYFKFRIHPLRVDLDKIKLYLSSALVIWAISIFSQLYNGFDIVIMGFFRKPEEVGYFTVARRIAGGVSLLMIYLANAVLPRLSSTFNNDMAEFGHSIRKFLKISALMIIFILVPVMTFSGQIISMTVGNQYLASSMPLKIMMVALVMIMFNLPYSTALIASRHEKDVLLQASATAAFSVVLNFILIPRYGMIGSSVSFLLAELVALSWILWAYNKRIRSVFGKF